MAKDTVATVTKAFNGVPDGQHHPKRFVEGDEVFGNLAEVAIKESWASKGAKSVPQPSAKQAEAKPAQDAAAKLV